MDEMRLLASGGLLCVSLVWADVRACACDPVKPETMAARECGLCREAEKHQPEVEVFFLKDINPRKPNRWLALPRIHTKGPHSMADLSGGQRAALWAAAIEKAKELFGERWGLAVNGDESRTQCHSHVHLGKLLEGVETANFVVVKSPAEIPVPADASGVWVHPDGQNLHVHLGEQITETVLFR